LDDWARLAELPLRVDGYDLQGLEPDFDAPFRRLTTVVRLHGGGGEGLGEDVTYEREDHLRWWRHGAVIPLAGQHTLASFSALLGRLELFPDPPTREESRPYRRWAFESAALDLALRQAGGALHQVLERRPRPVRFVFSTGLGRPPDTGRLRAWRALLPGLEFKLDAGNGWDEAFCAELGELGGVQVVDLKGHYAGTSVQGEADAALYQRVAKAFPLAWLEDPAWTPATREALAPHLARVSWDAPVHDAVSLAALDPRPRIVNVKPSRSGTVQGLLELYAWCAREGIAAYGGGQFELGPGRGQIQYLAALFHPGAPNDVAPCAFHSATPRPGTSGSPLRPAPAPTGFRWIETSPSPARPFRAPGGSRTGRLVRRALARLRRR